MFIGAKEAPVAKLADEGFDPKAFALLWSSRAPHLEGAQ
jgi:hypothetical protein